MASIDALETTEPVSDAVGLLTRDHRLIDQLFKEFDVAGDQQLDPLARRLCKMLRIHGQILEEIFYPAARRALGDSPLLDAAERVQAEVKQCLPLIESMTSADPAFRPAVKALAGVIRQHVKTDEAELLPKVRAAKLDLVSVGISLAERRDTLMDVLGLHADDEEAAVYPAENPAIALATAQRQQRER